MAAFANDPLVLALAPAAVSPLPNQPAQTDCYNPAPVISSMTPANNATTAPPLALIQVLVN